MRRFGKWLYDVWRRMWFAAQGRRKCAEYGCPRAAVVDCLVTVWGPEVYEAYCMEHALGDAEEEAA